MSARRAGPIAIAAEPHLAVVTVRDTAHGAPTAFLSRALAVVAACGIGVRTVAAGHDGVVFITDAPAGPKYLGLA